ncbi:YeeE/YedE family protein [Proteus cibarius]|uniref:YeeE/YedE family protein n=1 Tax=Proteus terrae subsp. cibarius TaxID=626774 RepID=A0ABX6JIF9_9GAMM|nr:MULTISPECIES: YeeE/YedE family protein [Proteus]QHP77327.1 YeeE/YedE family protein [Proteus vulgaris]MBG3091566.1 YeeE/YedE family protein [Proteus terrae subsp. cibarius]MBG6036625.1 YeeE/YedE family protein [Proteus terrae subsp. cibarius]MCM2367166.1 YeeE/YedE family protein [Proteus sp. FZP2095]QGW04030.1 YeeE/YedE family protein [Proteus terrae subsp. cibarius]
MNIDWVHFTPLSAAIGGLMIGAAAAILLLFNGRIAGISGILGGVLSIKQQGNGWRWAFLLGMLIAPTLFYFFDKPLSPVIETSPWMLIIAGVLVGAGTRLGNGCTSGHGICGLARLSRRSMVAVLVFMVTAFITVYIQRHVIGG